MDKSGNILPGNLLMTSKCLRYGLYILHIIVQLKSVFLLLLFYYTIHSHVHLLELSKHNLAELIVLSERKSGCAHCGVMYILCYSHISVIAHQLP
jgi:uncharacterized membrane protein